MRNSRAGDGLDARPDIEEIDECDDGTGDTEQAECQIRDETGQQRQTGEHQPQNLGLSPNGGKDRARSSEAIDEREAFEGEENNPESEDDNVLDGTKHVATVPARSEHTTWAPPTMVTPTLTIA